MDDINPDYTIDLQGMVCPVPLIKSSTQLNQMETGEILEILATDEAVLSDIPALSKAKGHDYLGHQQNGNIYQLYVRKG